MIASGKHITNPENTGKTLLIIRHAKSSWGIGMLNDFDRPLNDRGKGDAPSMAQRLLEKKIKLDHFISSPAKRAKTTAVIFAEKYKFPENAIELVPSLYHASPVTFFSVIETISNQYNNVAVFSHNPGITEFANRLTDKVRIDNMPTCGIFAIKIYSNKWKDFSVAKKEFLFFDYPKNT